MAEINSEGLGTDIKGIIQSKATKKKQKHFLFNDGIQGQNFWFSGHYTVDSKLLLRNGIRMI